MKHEDAPAPALARGLELIELLQGHPDISLEEIVQLSGFPKASVFRLMETLQGSGVVMRDEQRRYRLIRALQPWSAVSFEARLRALMQTAAGSTACTVEFFELTFEGLRMVQRVEPPSGEHHVVARIGFLRAWNDELDSVHAIGRGFGPARDVPGRLPYYNEDGKRGEITGARARREIERCQLEGVARDPNFNGNAVRRVAVPIFEKGRLQGVLAVASSFRFEGNADHAPTLLQCAREADFLTNTKD